MTPHETFLWICERWDDASDERHRNRVLTRGYYRRWTYRHNLVYMSLLHVIPELECGVLGRTVVTMDGRSWKIGTKFMSDDGDESVSWWIGDPITDADLVDLRLRAFT